MAKQILLALGGGGVRGIAHLGVVQCLLDNHYEIVGIAGSSAGGMFGAPVAAGHDPRKILEAVEAFFESPSFKREPNASASLVGTLGLQKVLENFLDKKNFTDLPIQFCVTAVSLKTGEETLIHEGLVMDGILATIAIPGVFPHHGDDVLIDGGILDPVPVKAARSFDPSLPIVAIALHTKPENYSPYESLAIIPDKFPEALLERISKSRFGEPLRAMSAGIELGSDRLTELTLDSSKPDVLVKPVVGQFAMLQKVDPSELFDEGYRAMEAELETLKEAFSLINSLKRISKYSLMSKD